MIRFATGYLDFMYWIEEEATDFELRFVLSVLLR